MKQSSSEDTHHSTLSEDYGKNCLPQHNSISAHASRPNSVQISRAESHFQRLSSAEQNRTIHFQDLDESLGDMNLTSNISEPSMSVYPMEDHTAGTAAGPSKVAPPFFYTEQQRQEKREHNGVIVTSVSQIMQEYVTMEVTSNIHSASLQQTEDRGGIGHQRQLCDEYTEDMELTADLMYSSRTALVDIPVNNAHVSGGPTISTPAAVKFPMGSLLPAVPCEEQENNPLLILRNMQNAADNTSLLRNMQNAADNTPLSPPGMNSSTMELTMNLPRPAFSVDFNSCSLVEKDPRDVLSTVQSSSLKGTVDNSSVEKSAVSGPSVDSVVLSARPRKRLTEQLTTQILSPVVEVSGLNCSSWSGSRTSNSSSFNRTGQSSSAIKQGSISHGTLEQRQDKAAPVTKTVYFGSPSADGLEITRNITCDIETGVNVDQERDLSSSSTRVDSEKVVSLEPQTKTVYFDSSSDAVRLGAVSEQAGDMELTETCSDSPVNLLPSRQRKELTPQKAQSGTVYFGQNEELGTAGDLELTRTYCDPSVNSVPPQHQKEFRSSERSSNSQAQSSTIYFGRAGDEGKLGDMELTEAVHNLSSGMEDPEVVLNFRRNSSERVHVELFPCTSEEAENTCQSKLITSLSKESSINVDRMGRIHQSEPPSSEHSKLCRSSDLSQKPNTITVSESIDSPAQHSKTLSLEINQSCHSLQSTQKPDQNGSHTKKIDSVKNNIIKDMNGLLNLSRRTSVMNKNMLSARRSLGGLLLSSQDKSSRRSLSNPRVLSKSLLPDSKDEVDGLISLSSAFDKSHNKVNSSEIVSVFSGADSPLLINNKSSVSNKSIALESDSPLIASGLKEKNIVVGGSLSKDKNLSFSAQVARTSSTTLSTPTGKTRHPSGEMDKTSSMFLTSQPEPATPSSGRESPLDDADLRDESDVLLEDLNLQNLVGKCDVDEEALDDFLQNLECMVSTAEPQTPKSEAVFTFEDIYKTIGFDRSPNSEKISPQREMEVASTGGKLQAKIAVLPKIETLEVFVQNMESAVKKLQQENQSKRELMRPDLSKIGCSLATDEGTKCAAVEMCRASRALAKSKWWQKEAGHLIEYSTIREEMFEKLHSDVERFKRETDRCSELTTEIDQCLLDIREIQQVRTDLEHEEKKLSEATVELDSLKTKSEELDVRASGIQKTSSKLVDVTGTVLSRQEKVKEQLCWIESLTEWTLLRESSEEMVFGFLFNTLVLQVQLYGSGSEVSRVSGISVRSRLAVVDVSTINCHNTNSNNNYHNTSSYKNGHNTNSNNNYHSTNSYNNGHDTNSNNNYHNTNSYNNCHNKNRNNNCHNTKEHSGYMLLLDVSTVVANCRQLSTEIRQAHFRHRVSINGLTLEVYVLESKKRQKIRLQTQFEAPCTYPNMKHSWTVTLLFGNADREAIRQAAGEVDAGQQYLTRVLAAVEKTLTGSSR
ncbi:hypothetical protein ElyMa_002635500 [Elysia marginata]|uniref:Spc7 kinetochore protein domain-containing protein n=1 Tax=Elysia marginata TaxID=1093978 RepID=A0AAV4H5X0_9GAST|nr:hypothetical protein ElyMa_002635500 [Elysia marginata]